MFVTEGCSLVKVRATGGGLNGASDSDPGRVSQLQLAIAATTILVEEAHPVLSDYTKP